MTDRCGTDHVNAAIRAGYRRVLWLVLVINATMFFVEGVAGLLAGSVALQADALDFLGDAALYAISLYVLTRSLRHRASASLLKGSVMGLFGAWVFGNSLYKFVAGGVPSAEVMGAVGFVALAANVGSAALLYRFRAGDSNMRSVWLCSRNDALGNIAVLLAASGVFATGSAWPDLVVGLILASLALSSSFQVIRQAVGELRAAGREGAVGS